MAPNAKPSSPGDATCVLALADAGRGGFSVSRRRLFSLGFLLDTVPPKGSPSLSAAPQSLHNRYSWTLHVGRLVSWHGISRSHQQHVGQKRGGRLFWEVGSGEELQEKLWEGQVKL